MSGRQLDWALLKELECPVCTQYMSSPIKMCENGHNICEGCKGRLSNCPSCRGMFVNVRNKALETLAAAAIYPCKNREDGCAETFTANDEGNHLAECLFQSKECPFRKLPGCRCTWTGTLSDIPVHIKDKHVSETAEVEGHFMVNLLDFSRGKSYHHAVLIMRELFYLTWEIERDAFRFGVFYFGPKIETEAFKYGIKLINSDGHVIVTRKCHSYTEGELKDLQPEKCVMLYYNTIRNCLSENTDLLCEIEIRKEKLDGFVSEESQECLQTVCAICVSWETAEDIATGAEDIATGAEDIASGAELGNSGIEYLFQRDFGQHNIRFFGSPDQYTRIMNIISDDGTDEEGE